MSLSMLKGKTKSDLIEIAHMTGLLTSKETNRMTKAQILEVLEKANQENTNNKDDSEVSAEEVELKLDQDVEETEKIPSEKSQKKTTKRATSKKTTRAKKPAGTEETEKTEAVEVEDTEKDKTPASEKEKTETKKATSKAKTTKRKADEEKEKETDIEEKDQETEKQQDQEEKTKAEPKAKASSAKTKTASKTSARKSRATEKKITEISSIASSPSKESDNHSENSDSSTDSDKKKSRQEKNEEQEIVSGILEIMPDNYGFLRVENYLQSNRDLYVPPQFIRRFGLRNGDKIEGPAKVQKDSDKYRAISYINKVNDANPEEMIKRPHFDRLTPIYPNEKYKLETYSKELATRMIDLISPIGKGQRGMIVSPPKAGKTILLQKIANSISINNPDAKLFVLLIDERPEEVTDMQRSINGEVVYSTFDKTPENHVKVTELVLERAMRLVELGQDVVILLDSITRMARAYNLTINPSGRTLSGGLDPGALHGPKRFFGAARNIEHGGSLTIVATALVDTGSRMDEVIFEEFKGTGNMEVVLDRKLAEKRVFPAIDLNKSSTRREDLLMSKEELNTVWAMRKAFSGSETLSVTETVINLLLKTKTNEQFANSISISLKDKDLFEAMRGNPASASYGNGTSGTTRPNGNGVR